MLICYENDEDTICQKGGGGGGICDNNNNSYIAPYPVEIYRIASLYIINIKMRLTIKKKKKKKKGKYYKSIHQYQNDKKPRMRGGGGGGKREREKKREESTVNAYIDIKAFHTHCNNHKSYKIMYILIST